VSVTVTESVTTVTPTGVGTTVTVTEDVTSVSVSDSTATITVTPSQTSVSVSGNTTSITVSGENTSVNVTENTVGTSGSQVIDGQLKIVKQKDSDASYPEFNTPLLHVTTKDRSSGKMICISESDNTPNDNMAAIGMTPNASFGSLFIGTANCGLHLTSQLTNTIQPCNAIGVSNDNTISLGSASATFKDIYATDTTINTSDRNKKQDIQDLSEAERQVATACKGLIKKYKWRSAVESKGGDARWHFGIIAQELEQAFTDYNLDAGDYGVFVKEEVEVDGVVEVHRAVRYNELLAFIIAVS
jgi:hypothetical protein